MDKAQSTELLFEIGHAGRRCHRLPACDVPAAGPLLPRDAVADSPPPLPEVGEIDLVRHYVNLSTRNMSIDTNFYPLGSCTMKYNPKRHERLASLPGLANLHPLQADESCQGMLQILWEMQNILAEIAGLDAVSLQPAAGAQGELTALLVAAAYFRDRRETRTRVLIPDRRHGTNPASAAIAGFEAVTVKSTARGLVDLDDLRGKLDERTAVFMITNPNTLGLFEGQIATITEMIHACGGLVYLDGANMNAILGITRPGDFGADMMHYNVHKTFTGPHGAGGPGAGPIAVRRSLEPFLPAPVVAKEGDHYRLDYQRPKSIGRVRSFFGNVGILLRGYFYIRTLGPDGLKQVSEQAVLNANYLLSRIKHAYEVPHGDRCMHEFVASAQPPQGAAHQRHGHRQTPARFRLPCADRVLPAGGARGADDRADRNRKQGNAGRLRRHAAAHPRGGCRLSARSTAHAGHQPARRGQGRQGADPALATVRSVSA